MKKNMMLRMVAFFFLVALAPYGLWAEPGPCPVDSPRAKELWTKAPQTPEALLRVLKAFMDNQKMNGFELGERVFGLAREAWGAPFAVLGSGGVSKKQIDYTPFLRGGGQSGPPYKPLPTATPYYMGEGYIKLDENDDLLLVKIRSFKEGFCVTPTLMRKILGEPERVVDGGISLHLGYYWDKYGLAAQFPDFNNKEYRQHGYDPKIKNKLLSNAEDIDERFRKYREICAQEIVLSRRDK